MDELGQIKFLSEREVTMVEMKFDIDDVTADRLAFVGLNMIKHNRDELCGFAIRRLLEEYAERKGKCKTKKRSSKKSSRR